MPDDDWSDPTEYDPRWEVQPVIDDGDDSSGGTRRALLVIAGGVALALLAWLLLDASRAF
jgi:hypothetical protein